MSLWSEDAPNREASSQSFQKTFSDVSSLEITSEIIRKVAIEGDKATVQMVVEMNAVDAKRGKPAEGFGKKNRTFHIVRSSSDWKISKYVLSEEELADRIVSTKADEDRRAILESDPELITTDLVESPSSKALVLFYQTKYPDSISIYEAAQGVATRVTDRKGLAAVIRGMGTVFLGFIVIGNPN
jgi:hypothetical protein